MENGGNNVFTVIPAQAGIQCFRPDMPARKQAGMTTSSGGRRDTSQG